MQELIQLLPIQINLNSQPQMESLTLTYSLDGSLNSKLSRVYALPRSSIGKGSSFQAKNRSFIHKDGTDTDLAKVIHALSHRKQPEIAMQLHSEMKAKGFPLGCNALSALMICYAQNGLFDDASALWDELVHSWCKPGTDVVSALMHAYAKMGKFDEIEKIVHESASRGFVSELNVCSLAVSCFGEFGQLRLMEKMIRTMVLRGLKVDSLTGNTFVKYYSVFGTLDEMDAAYQRLKKSRILIEEEAIRAVAHAYINKNKFYELGEFVRDVGLRRRNTGNLLWNLLLLSYAANFKMKSLQREFLNMLEAGFSPDLTTFNLRALAFSRMCMFWDLHLSIKHMKHERIVPDLVTYGCIVDIYLERRLARNLSFALDEMDAESTPVVQTDLVVFEVFGKGDFHSTSEIMLESNQGRDWTYSKLVKVYLKKQYRRNQIFWNY